MKANSLPFGKPLDEMHRHQRLRTDCIGPWLQRHSSFEALKDIGLGPDFHDKVKRFQHNEEGLLQSAMGLKRFRDIIKQDRSLSPRRAGRALGQFSNRTQANLFYLAVAQNALQLVELIRHRSDLSWSDVPDRSMQEVYDFLPRLAYCSSHIQAGFAIALKNNHPSMVRTLVELFPEKTIDERWCLNFPRAWAGALRRFENSTELLNAGYESDQPMNILLEKHNYKSAAILHEAGMELPGEWDEQRLRQSINGARTDTTLGRSEKRALPPDAPEVGEFCLGGTMGSIEGIQRRYRYRGDCIEQYIRERQREQNCSTGVVQSVPLRVESMHRTSVVLKRPRTPRDAEPVVFHLAVQQSAVIETPTPHQLRLKSGRTDYCWSYDPDALFGDPDFGASMLDECARRIVQYEKRHLVALLRSMRSVTSEAGTVTISTS